MRRQRGVALITALLVVAIATTAAVAMAVRQQVDIRRTGNVLDGDQAYLYVFGVEDWAGQVLRRDREDNSVDHASEDWATQLPAMPVDGGQLAGALEDLQGRFNVNNLIKDGQADPAAVQQFRSLLAALGLSFELGDALVDWIDTDLEPTIPAGAEDPVYLGRERPYRAANRPMADITELRLVAGFTEPPPVEMATACRSEPRPARTIYDVIAGCLSALPETTPINVNTAPLPVLMSLSSELTEADAQALADARGEEGFDSVDAFLQHEALAGRNIEAGALAVATRYFQLNAQVMVGRATLRTRSTLWRADNGATQVLSRAQETF